MAWGATLLCLIAGECALAAWPTPRPLNLPRLEAAGLRVATATHAEVVTDTTADIEALARLIDQAIPQWAARFGVDEAAWRAWRVRVCLVREESRFRALGLWPLQSADFPHGLSLGYELWLREQDSAYYQRHLLIHEATHSFMSTLLGSCGPGWYMEGIAELCGTHAIDPAGRLRLAVMPPTRDAAPDWGRVRRVRDAVAAERLLPIDAVRRIDNRVAMSVESYAWAWALCSFLDRHPAYQERFRSLVDEVASDTFDEQFDNLYAPDRSRLESEWRHYAATIDYGHDLAREALTPAERPARVLSLRDTARVRVAADRGWQSTGVRVRAGVTHRITARGRFVIAREPDGSPWPCEANGVTLEYHQGRPLGQLLAAVEAGPDSYNDSVGLGTEASFTPRESGTLWLRVNDSPARLSENEGELAVEITVD